MDFTVVLAQIKPKLGCVADNLALIEERIEQAKAAGADLVVFPELALTGYFLKDLVPEVARRLDSPEISPAGRTLPRYLHRRGLRGGDLRLPFLQLGPLPGRRARSDISTARSISPPTACSTNSATWPGANVSAPLTASSAAWAS